MHLIFLKRYLNDFTLFRFVVRNERFRFLFENDSKGFEHVFRMTANRNTIKILIKHNSKTLIVTESVKFVFNKSELGLGFGIRFIFGRGMGKFVRNVLDQSLALNEVFMWPVALMKNIFDIFGRKDLCLWKNFKFQIIQFIRII